MFLNIALLPHICEAFGPIVVKVTDGRMVELDPRQARTMSSGNAGGGVSVAGRV